MPDQTATDLNWRDDLRRLLRSVLFDVRAAIRLFGVGCAVFGASLVPYDPFADDLPGTLLPPYCQHWFGTDQLAAMCFPM